MSDFCWNPSSSVPTHRVISVLALAFTGLGSLTGAFGSDLWNDRSLRIVQTTQANFPVALAAEGVSEGEVRVVLNVDSGGKLIDYLVTGYTRRELADEWVAQVGAWSFEPARRAFRAAIAVQLPTRNRTELPFGSPAMLGFELPSIALLPFINSRMRLK